MDKTKEVSLSFKPESLVGFESEIDNERRTQNIVVEFDGPIHETEKIRDALMLALSFSEPRPKEYPDGKSN